MEQSTQPIGENKSAHTTYTASSSPDPILTNTSQPKKSHKTAIIILVLVLAILAVGGVTLAYVTGWNPFQTNLSSEQVISKMLDSITDVKSAHYDVEGSFKAEPREAGAQPITVDLPEFDQKKEALKRDQQRLTALNSIVSQLQFEKSKNKKYPLSLAALFPNKADTITDPATHQQYGYRQDKGGADFTLDIQLETDAAARAYQTALENQAKYSDKEVPTKEATQLIELHDGTPVAYASVSFSDISPYPLGFSLDDMYQYLPVEVDANLKVAGQSESDVTKSNDSSFNASGKLALGGTSFSAGLDILKIADAFFVRVNEAPSLGFFDLAALKGKWIKAVPEDAYGTFLGSVFYRGDDKGVDKQSARLITQYQLLFRLLKEENLIQVSQEFPQEKANNEKLYHYAIKLDRSKFAEFYKRLTEETKKEFGEDAIFKFNEETLTYLQSQEFAKFYDALEKNIQLELWVDASDFSPRKISYTHRLVPPDSIVKLKDKQYHFNITVGLSDVNQPVTVDAPPTTISVDEARTLLTGETLEQIKYRRQVAQVQAIREAIRLYYGHTGHDPQTLSELLKKINDVPAGPAPTKTDEFAFSNYQLKDLKDKNKPFLTILPKDIYTSADYGYTSDGKTYKLTYQIKLPPKQEDKIQDYQYNYIRRENVEGLNTATEKVMSLEAEEANKTNPR